MDSSKPSRLKKAKHVEIFNMYAEQLKEKNGEQLSSNALNSPIVLSYDNFLQILKDSSTCFSTENIHTDHKYNLNRISSKSMGLIFFTVDEQNKGYLTLQEWLHFNCLLDNQDYQDIFLFEFFKKLNNKKNPPISYKNRFLSFDSLLIDLDTLKKSLTNVNNFINKNTTTVEKNKKDKNNHNSNSINNNNDNNNNNVLLNWNSFKWLDDYIIYGKNSNSISLNGLLTLIQTDLKYYKTKHYFNCFKKQGYKSDDPSYKSYINKNDLIKVLELQYSHKINNMIFQSINLSNSHLLKCTNDKIPYNTYLDFIYLFDNFDVLNQLLLNYCSTNQISLDISLKNFQDHIITKPEFMEILTGNSYNKVNNIIQFSPSQINILFSIVANAKNKELKLIQEQEEEQKAIEYEKETNSEFHTDFINKKFLKNELLVKNPEEKLDVFNDNYQNMMEDSSTNLTYTNSKFIAYLFDKFVTSKLFRPKDSTAINTHSLNYLNLHDFFKIVNPNYLNDLIHDLEKINTLQEANKLESNFFFLPIFDNISNFIFGSISGIIGATIVYPIDILKTRMQAQTGNTIYKSYVDCFWKIVKNEGFKGLYSGLKPQLIGVAPEKAIKLTVNDSMRSFFQKYKKSNKLHPLEEIISGATAGASQVMFTNPLEIVKIRLQMINQNGASEIAETAAKNTIKRTNTTAWSIVKKLGLAGLYKGSFACLARDIPFSAIYFPTYAHIKRSLFNFDAYATTTTTTTAAGRSLKSTTHSPTHDPACAAMITHKNKLNTWELLVSGAIAGMPAAYFTTPFDVIKTRLQMDSRTSAHKYTGIWQTAKTILREESFKAFFKGGTARVLRSSPQFGFTLAAYEIFQSMLPQHDNNAGTSVSTSGKLDHSTNFKDTDYHYKSCNIVKSFIDLDPSFSKFDKHTYEDISNLVRSSKS